MSRYITTLVYIAVGQLGEKKKKKQIVQFYSQFRARSKRKLSRRNRWFYCSIPLPTECAYERAYRRRRHSGRRQCTGRLEGSERRRRFPRLDFGSGLSGGFPGRLERRRGQERNGARRVIDPIYSPCFNQARITPFAHHREAGGFVYSTPVRSEGCSRQWSFEPDHTSLKQSHVEQVHVNTSNLRERL